MKKAGNDKLRDKLAQQLHKEFSKKLKEAAKEIQKQTEEKFKAALREAKTQLDDAALQIMNETLDSIASRYEELAGTSGNTTERYVDLEPHPDDLVSTITVGPPPAEEKEKPKAGSRSRKSRK